MKLIFTALMPCLVILLSTTTLGNSDVDQLVVRAKQVQQQKMLKEKLPSPLVGDDLFAKELSGGRIQSGEMHDLIDEFTGDDKSIELAELPIDSILYLKSVSTYGSTQKNEVFINTDIDATDNGLAWYTHKLDSADEQSFSTFISAPKQITNQAGNIQTVDIVSFLQEVCRRVDIEEYILLEPQPCFQRFPFVKTALNLQQIIASVKDNATVEQQSSVNLQIFKNGDDEFAFVIYQNNSESQIKLQTILTYSTEQY